MQILKSIFRAYDVRGIFNEDLTTDVAYLLGLAFGSECLEQKQQSVYVGRDGRHSSPILSEFLIKGLIDTGINVVDLGAITTPMCYFAAANGKDYSCIMITGSHNPKDYNGFKMVINGNALSGSEIEQLYTRIISDNFQKGLGKIEQVNINSIYQEYILNNCKLNKKLKVVIDCGNGISGIIAESIFKNAGCDVTMLYDDVDGDFPNHHPDPAKIENLTDLIKKVSEIGADVGLAFDGDADRVGVITATGQFVYPDRLMMLFIEDILSRNKNSKIIYDVKCTSVLHDVIQKLDGVPIMWKTGHSLIKKKMREENAIFAGEMSGHIFFKERWFGFDDGIYSALRLLEILSNTDAKLDAMLAKFPEKLSTPEINIKVTDVKKFEIIDKLQKNVTWPDNVTKSTLDGIRIDNNEGFGLIRASNTTPILVLRFEAQTQTGLEQMKNIFRAAISQIDKNLSTLF